MDPQRLKAAYAKLQALDERLTHKVRPRVGGPLLRPGTEQIEEQLRVLATYTVELKEIVEELVLAIGTRPQTPPAKGGGR